MLHIVSQRLTDEVGDDAEDVEGADAYDVQFTG
jgi:hypothetical protein